MRTVFVTWLPLAIAGIVLMSRREVHATMRGAAPLRVLALSSRGTWCSPHWRHGKVTVEC
jgi:hypothetical protein